MLEAIERVLASKKAMYAAVPGIANLLCEVLGIDVTQPAVLVLDAAFASLLVAQFALDLRWGSCSDNTGCFK